MTVTSEKLSSKGPALPSSFYGNVKQVLSYNLVLASAFIAGNTAVDQKVYISDIQIPRSPGANSVETQFAYECKEFLRRLLTNGSRVKFDLKGTTPNMYGTIILNEAVDGHLDVRNILLSKGLVMLRPQSSSNENKTLQKLESESKSAKLGLWGMKSDQLNKPRKIIKIDNLESFLEKYKNKILDGVINKVIEPTKYMICLTIKEPKSNDPSYVNVKVSLSGANFVQDESKSGDKSGLYKEAVTFLESYILSRDVKVNLEGTNKAQTFLIGSVYNEETTNLALILIMNGVASVDLNTISIAKDDPNIYFKLEDEAKASRVRMWANYTPPKTLTSTENKFTGVLIKVTDWCGLIIKNEATNVEKAYTLSGVRTPKSPQALDNIPDRNTVKCYGYDLQARELLRRFVGRVATVVIDYTVKEKDTERTYVTVTISKKNLAQLLISEGLASVIPQARGDLKLSRTDIMNLNSLYNEAVKKKVGMHSGAKEPIVMYKDATVSTACADSALKELLRERKITGIIVGVISPTKYRLFIHGKSSNYIAILLLSGIFSPRDTSYDPADAKRLAEIKSEAFSFVQRNVLQRNVAIELDKTLTPTGNFAGSLFIVDPTKKGQTDVTLMLLSNGYAQTAFSRKHENDTNLSERKVEENKAKLSKKGIWELLEKQVKKASENQSKSSKPSKHELKDVVLTYIDHNTLVPFFQIVSGDSTKKLENIANKLNAQGEDICTKLSSEPVIDQVYAVKYNTDNRLYRASIKTKLPSDTYTVYFIDYGNTEEVKLENIYELPKDLGVTTLKPQAVQYDLLCVDQSFAINECPDGYADALNNFTSNCSLRARIEREGATGKDTVILFDSDWTTVNEKMLLEGFAPMPKNYLLPSVEPKNISSDLFQVPSDNESQKRKPIINCSFGELVSRFRSAQEIAKRERKMLWENGDFTDVF